MINLAALEKAWCKETSYYDSFDRENISKGQCVPTALLVQDILGGEIYGCMVGRTRHFYNVTTANTIDLTSHQFDSPEAVVAARLKTGYKSDRKVLLTRPGVADRYELLKERYKRYCEESKSSS